MRPTRHAHADPDAPPSAPTALTRRALATAGALVASAAIVLAAPLASATAATAATAANAAPAATAAAASRPASAQKEYLAAINAVGDQGVHFASHGKQGTVTIAVTGDTGAKSGTETFTLRQGKNLEHMTVTLVGSTGYVNGNTTALRDIFGASAAVAKKYAGHWISFNSTSSQYNELAAGLLDSEVASELKMSGPFHYGTTTTINGTRVYAIKGGVSDQSGSTLSSTLFVAASGPPLPLEQTTGPSNKGTFGDTVTFTKWGQNVAQKAPAHATPASKLTASSSGSTTTQG